MAVESSQKSIVEQIVDTMIEKLEDTELFSQEIIKKILEISKAGNLNRKDPLIEALESQIGDNNETT